MTTRARLMATAVAALLAAGGAHAQQGQAQPPQGGDAASGAAAARPQAQGQDAADQDMAGQDMAGQDAAGEPSGAAAEGAMGPDTLIATVGEARITGADVVATIDALPPQLHRQPPALLIPMAVNSPVTHPSRAS